MLCEKRTGVGGRKQEDSPQLCALGTLMAFAILANRSICFTCLVVMAFVWATLSDDELGSPSSGPAWAALSQDDAPVVDASPGAWASLSEDALSDSAGEHASPASARPGGLAPRAAAPLVEPPDDYGHGLGVVHVPRGALRAGAVSKLFKSTREASREAKQAFQDARATPGSHTERPGLAIEHGDGVAFDGAFALPPDQPVAAAVGLAIVAMPAPRLLIAAPSCIGALQVAARCLEQAAHIASAIDERHPGHPLVSGSEAEREAVSHLLAGTTTFSSDACEAALANTKTWALKRLRGLIAMCMVLLGVSDAVHMLATVADDMIASGGKCLCLLESFKADETSLKFKVADQEQARIPGLTKALAVSSTALEAVASQSAMTKVLQSHRSVAALFESKCGQHILIERALPMPLQVMSSTKMDVYARCYMQTQLPLGELAPKFNRHVRLCLSDGDNSIGAMFRTQAEGTGIPHLIHQCDIHKVSNRIDDATPPPRVWQYHVSSIIAFAKSLEQANSMRMFRESLRLALAARLQWKRRRPKTANVKHNMFMLRLCIGGDSKTEQLRIKIISMLFNGRWDRTDVVEHDCAGPECCASQAECLQKMLTIGVAALAAVGPPKFPRHRWTGIMASLAWPLLMDSTHGLLSVVYKLYAAQLRGGKTLQQDVLREMARAGRNFGADGGADEAIEDFGYRNVVDGAAHGRFAGGAPGAGQEYADPQPMHPMDSVEARRLEQSQDRAKALQWMSNDPVGMLFVLRVCLHPLAATMDRYLMTAGAQWDKKQEVVEAKAQSQPAAKGRTFRFYKAASDEMVGDSLSEVAALMKSKESWDHLPFRFRSAAFRTRTTLTLSKVGCGLFRLQCEHLASARFPEFVGHGGAR